MKLLRKAGSVGKIGVVFMTAFLLGILIFSVPARASAINFDISSTKVTQGDVISFNADLNSESINGTVLKLGLELKSDEIVKTCEFTTNGIILSGCEDIIVTPISSNSSYGYGYGYGSQTVYNSFKLLLNTEKYPTGDYASSFIVYTTAGSFYEPGQIITINSGSSGIYSSDYSSSRQHICLSGWQCSDWSSCVDGKQTRVCDVLPNCYLDNKPLEERLCIGDDFEQKLFSPYDSIEKSISLGNINPKTGEFEFAPVVVTNESLVLFIFALMISIIILLIWINLILLFRIFRRNRRIRSRRAYLNKIRYRPQR